MKLQDWNLWQGLLALLCGLGFAAHAAELHVAALSVPYASPWQRATAQEEAGDGSLLLAIPDAALHLAVPRQTRMLKWDAATYYARLRDNWQDLYGDQAIISWLATGTAPLQQKWLLCRRPSREQGVNVFHLSTVFAGRTYNLVFFAPSSSKTLPQPALDLLAKLAFNSEMHRATSRTGWTMTRILHPPADADILDVLVLEDVARLGADGMLTGYGLKFSAEPEQSSVAWFIEGYQWRSVDSRVVQVPWTQSGRLEVRPEMDTAVWPMTLTLADNEADIRASLRMFELCAPAPQLDDALQQLQTGTRQTLQALMREPATGCPPVTPATATTGVLQGESGKTVQANLPLALPPMLNPAQRKALGQAGLTRIALVEIALNPTPSRTGFGERLLEQARWYVVFEPEQADAAEVGRMSR